MTCLAPTLIASGGLLELVGVFLVARDIGGLGDLRAKLESRATVVSLAAPVSAKASAMAPTVHTTGAAPPSIDQRVTSLERVVGTELPAAIRDTEHRGRKYADTRVKDLSLAVTREVHELRDDILDYFAEVVGDLGQRRLGIRLLLVGIAVTVAGSALGTVA